MIRQVICLCSLYSGMEVALVRAGRVDKSSAIRTWSFVFVRCTARPAEDGYGRKHITSAIRLVICVCPLYFGIAVLRPPASRRHQSVPSADKMSQEMAPLLERGFHPRILTSNACMPSSSVCIPSSNVCIPRYSVWIPSSNTYIYSSNACILDSNACILDSKACILDSNACILDSSACISSTDACILDSSTCISSSSGCISSSSNCIPIPVAAYQAPMPVYSAPMSAYPALMPAYPILEACVWSCQLACDGDMSEFVRAIDM